MPAKRLAVVAEPAERAANPRGNVREASAGVVYRENQRSRAPGAREGVGRCKAKPGFLLDALSECAHGLLNGRYQGLRRISKEMESQVVVLFAEPPYGTAAGPALTVRAFGDSFGDAIGDRRDLTARLLRGPYRDE